MAALSLIERGGTCREIVLVDRAAERAAGVAVDMRYAAPLSPVVDVRAGDYQDLIDAALVVITAGANEKAGGATDRADTQGRLRLLDTNAKIYADIVPRIVAVAPQAVLMVVTDPGSRFRTGIVWASHPITLNANQAVVPGMLRAIDAGNLSRELWNSTLQPNDNLGLLAKFTPPTVANGRSTWPRSQTKCASSASDRAKLLSPSSCAVVVRAVLGKDGPQVPLAKDQDAIGADRQRRRQWSGRITANVFRPTPSWPSRAAGQARSATLPSADWSRSHSRR